MMVRVNENCNDHSGECRSRATGLGIQYPHPQCVSTRLKVALVRLYPPPQLAQYSQRAQSSVTPSVSDCVSAHTLIIRCICGHSFGYHVLGGRCVGCRSDSLCLWFCPDELAAFRPATTINHAA